MYSMFSGVGYICMLTKVPGKQQWQVGVRKFIWPYVQHKTESLF